MEDTKGFTLVEVMAAFVILLMVSQMFLLGLRFSAKMEKRAEELESLRCGIGAHLMDGSDCVYGSVRLKMGDRCEDLLSDGWMYDNEAFHIIWVEECPDE